jgi:hypothetical protein
MHSGTGIDPPTPSQIWKSLWIQKYTKYYAKNETGMYIFICIYTYIHIFIYINVSIYIYFKFTLLYIYIRI